MKNFVLEVCVDSVESAIAAAEGGATRLELCANLLIRGTTPSLFLYREVRKLLDIPIHCILRPRYGDFCYTESEVRIMKGEAEQFRQEGADGIVIGALCPDGSLDLKAMETICESAEGMHIAVHRAFDACSDPFAALAQAEKLGVKTILTSGLENHCLDGAELIRDLSRAGSIDIMAGGGVTAENIPELWAKTGVTSYHLSGLAAVKSPMVYRNSKLQTGLPSHSEYELWRTKSDMIAAARRVLDEL